MQNKSKHVIFSLLVAAFFYGCGVDKRASENASDAPTTGGAALGGSHNSPDEPTSDGGGLGTGGVAGQEMPRGGDPNLSLLPGTDAWLDQADTTLGLQGPWYTFTSTDSTISEVLADDSVCVSGQGAQVLGEPPDWGTYYGAAIAVDLCHSGSEGSPPDTAYPLGACPFATEILQTMVGVRFNIEGQLPPELRIVFRESGRGESPYLNVNNEGEFVALFEDARVAYKPSAPPPNPSEVDGLQFMIATNASGPSPFDFCITDLEAIVGDAPDTSGVPSWVREPGPGKQNDLVGVNLAVAEFGSDRRAEFGTDYTYPTTEEVDYFMGKGMNVFRVPFGWERMQPTLMGELDTQNIVALSEFVTYATDAGATVVLDPHNYARYDGELIGSEAVPNAAFADFWSRIATVFKDNQFVAYGLMNEPHSLGDNGTENWLVSANVAIAAIRDTGAQQLILVPGNQWTGAHSWNASYYGTPNGEVMQGVIDPEDNFIFEVHQYLDANSSGTDTECESDTIGSERLADFTAWARTHGVRALLGEFGAYPTDTCFRALDDMLRYIGENDDVWAGWTWWAAGPWWGGYGMSIEPEQGKDRPQMLLLERHLSP